MWDFKNVNHAKNETLKLWILSKMRFWNCEVLDKLQIFAPVWNVCGRSERFWDPKSLFFPLIEGMNDTGTWRAFQENMTGVKRFFSIGVVFYEWRLLGRKRRDLLANPWVMIIYWHLTNSICHSKGVPKKIRMLVKTCWYTL